MVAISKVGPQSTMEVRVKMWGVRNVGRKGRLKKVAFQKSLTSIRRETGESFPCRRTEARHWFPGIFTKGCCQEVYSDYRNSAVACLTSLKKACCMNPTYFPHSLLEGWAWQENTRQSLRVYGTSQLKADCKFQ